MKTLVALMAGLGCALGPSPTASAQAVFPAGRSFVVDDSGSVVLDPYLEMQAPPIAGAAPSNIVSASTRVSVQLNLAAWVGRSGRIYMSLPRTTGPTVRANWTSGGALLPGTMVSGDRSLVFSGPIAVPVVRDIIDIRLEVDGTRLLASEALAFGFEIEVDP
jgi:hypothetical protein